MSIVNLFIACENAARKYLKTDHVQTVSITLARLQSQNFSVDITVNHESETKTLKFFAKLTRKIPKINQILFDDFTTIIPKFDAKITPKLCYAKRDLLLFEDMTCQGYSSKVGSFNLDDIRVVLSVLAKFHAGSFAFEEIKSRELGKSYRLSDDHELVDCNVSLKEDEVAKLLSSLLDISEEKLTKLIQDFEERQLSSKFRKTLCHGDLVSENIMFKCESRVAVDCKLINFKSEHYAPPGHDVLQVIFFNTSEHFRQQHLDTLLIHYHECLKKELESYCGGIEEMSTEDLQLSANYLLPLIKLETILQTQNSSDDNRIVLEDALEAFKEIINCPLLTREDCYVIVKNKMGTTNYDFLSFTMTLLEEVNGFAGDYHKLQIKIRHQSEDKTINCFVKSMPKGTSAKAMAEETGCFSKESFIYKTLVPEMLKLGINTINECLPSCYFQQSEDVMIFEDLSQLNYRTLPPQIPYDFNLLSLITKKLAKFHASTFIFEEKMSTKLKKPYRLNEEYGQYLHEILYLKDANHSAARLVQNGIKSITDVINLFPDLKTKDNQTNLRKAWPKLTELFFDVIKTSDRFRNVLSHGDIWINNIMVQFDDDKPIDCCYIDFQCTRYCPPAHDFLSVVYLTTDRATRMKHAEAMKKIYHDELSEILTSYDYDINEIYPYKEFEAIVNCTKPQMVMQAINDYSFTMCTSEELSTILVNDDVYNQVFLHDRKDYLAAMCEKSSLMKKKLRECILDLYDLCDSMSSSV